MYFSDETVPLNILRGIAVCSPHGALSIGVLRITGECSEIRSELCVVPPYWQIIVIIAGEAIVFAIATYFIDRRDFLPLQEQEFQIQKDELSNLDDDVAAERTSVLTRSESAYSLRFANLRKLFPGKGGQPPLEAVKALNLGITRGELFGLLGANGAGKTTAILCVMRVLYPNAGSVHIEGHSVGTNFTEASKHLGVVTQHNTLWEKLSCTDHLRLFARVRGVPPSQLEAVVQSCIERLELGPYANRLAGQLSGGMKRKLVMTLHSINLMFSLQHSA